MSICEALEEVLCMHIQRVSPGFQNSCAESSRNPGLGENILLRAERVMFEIPLKGFSQMGTGRSQSKIKTQRG